MLSAHRKFSILQLESTFSAIAVPHVTCGIPADEIDKEAYIFSLISNGTLPVHLIQAGEGSQSTVLRFLPSAAISDHRMEKAIETQLATQRSRLLTLLHDMSISGMKLQLGREYVEWSQRASRRKDDESGTSGIGAFQGGNSLEEDMMADLH